jgi:hypothetical protein
MKLTRAAGTIIAKDSGASLHRRVTELEKVKDVLQCAIDHGIEDYDLLVTGNKNLSSERDELKSRCEGLQAELAEVHSDAEKRVAILEAKVRSVEAHNIVVASASEKRLREFEGGLVRKLEELHGLYSGNVRIISGLCSLMPVEEPSVEDYLRWLSDEISGLPDVFSSVNENFATAAIEGALTMAGDSIDLDVVRDIAVEGGADVFPTGSNVRRVTWAVSITTMCCRLFVLNKMRYLFILMFCFNLEVLTLLLLSLRPR